MKTLTAILLLMVLVSCGQADRQADLPKPITNIREENVALEQKEEVPFEITGTTEPVQAEIPEFTCVRGAPEASLDEAVFPTREFTLIDSTSATEAVDLSNGDRLIILHGGCESYVQTYRFETSRWNADTSDLSFWYEKAVQLLSEIEKADHSPIDIKAGMDALATYNDQNIEKQLGYDLELTDSEIREYVTFDRVHQIQQGRFAVEITYAIGPL